MIDAISHPFYFIPFTLPPYLRNFFSVMRGMYLTILVTFAVSSNFLESFSVSYNFNQLSICHHNGCPTHLFTVCKEDDNPLKEPSRICDPLSMSIREIKNELDERHISFSDCFERDSLVNRLIDARSEATISNIPDSNSKFLKEEEMEKLRSKKVRELRTMCAEKNIKWANMIEKEELVRALLDFKEMVSKFSLSGKLIPGKVTKINGQILKTELSGGWRTPLLLDCYATWCGPCKMMAPQLDETALYFGDKVRVVKIDSDENPAQSSQLRVEGFPTIIIFDGLTGKELERCEGALMKDQIIQLTEKYINSQ